MPTLTGDVAVLVASVCGSGLVAFTILVAALVLSRLVGDSAKPWKDE